MKGMSDAKSTTHQITIKSFFWSSNQNERINHPEWTWIDQSGIFKNCSSRSSGSLGFSVVALGLTSLYWLTNLAFCTGLQFLQLHKKVHVQELASE